MTELHTKYHVYKTRLCKGTYCYCSHVH